MIGRPAVDDLGIRCLVALEALGETETADGADVPATDVAAARTAAEEEAVAAIALLLEEPPEAVVGWLADAVLAAAAGRSDDELARIAGTVLTIPGMVAATVAALRAEDTRRLYEVAGDDLVDVVVHLAAVVVALDGHVTEGQ